MKLLVVFYSMYGHVMRMAEAEAEGAYSAGDIDVEIKQVPETIPEDVLKKSGAWEIFEAKSKYEVVKPADLAEADAVIFGTPTRFGMMCAQMRQLLDMTGGHWARQELAGKVGSVFTSSNTQHGGQESTILNFHTTLLHHGMLIAGLPYLFQGQTTFEEITGCSPYGASTVVGGDNAHMPTENELAGARFQGKYVASVAKVLAPEREKLIKGM
jgi:NAD(P)H dehydrogenase (quinone)